MPVGQFSRYRNLDVCNVVHVTRGRTRTLPIRRTSVELSLEGNRQLRISGFETIDLLALKFFHHEELYWHILDANDGRLPNTFEPGEKLSIPSLSLVTRITRPGN